MNKIVLAAAAATLIAFVGCKKEEGAGAPSGGTAAAPAAPATAPTAAAPAEPAAAPAGDKIGVESCDKYIAAMQKCMAAAPAESRAAMDSALKTTADTWKQAIQQGGDAAKQGLEAGCTSALSAAKTAYAGTCAGAFE